MAGQHFSERELALLCLNHGSRIAVSTFSLCFLASLLSQLPRHRNRRLQLLRPRREDLLFPRFRRNNLCRPPPPRNKHLHLRLREVSGSVSFLRQGTARSALGSTIKPAKSCASCMRTRNWTTLRSGLMRS